MKEEQAIVLDYLSRGYSSSYTGEPIAQAVGTTRFTLLELVPRDGVFLSLRQQVYIGPDERKEVKFIKGRLEYAKLTNAARNELPLVIEETITANEAKYVEFFNKAGPISIRKHSLELLPSVGKKHMEAIVDERERKPFDSFKNLTERVNLMPNPVRVIQERVLEELQGNGIKYYIFTAPPKRDDAPRRYR
ncbi:MAG: DUF655 domain-containing protein [Candidatus Diapherotrites archaeon]|nr:DUF655 domain-containing protein [Candidatus Diapherotrites archaeon]